MLISIFRVFFLYILMILVMRIMGKREIGQLQPYELAITLIISELITLPMEDNSVPLLKGVVPVITITLAQILFSYLTTKNQKLQDIISGKYTIIVEDGQMLEENMRKQKYNITELLEQLRMNGILNISDVKYAILETSGQLSVILKGTKQSVTAEQMNIITQNEDLPVNIILDGKIVYENLNKANISLTDLKQKMLEEGNCIKDIFYANINKKGEYYIQKKSK